MRLLLAPRIGLEPHKGPQLCSAETETVTTMEGKGIGCLGDLKVQRAEAEIAQCLVDPFQRPTGEGAAPSIFLSEVKASTVVNLLPSSAVHTGPPCHRDLGIVR